MAFRSQSSSPRRAPKLLGPERLLERIGQRLDLLKGGRDVDERHATLRATIAWSYDLLDEDEQRLFCALAVFRGGCTLEDAEAVAAADVDTLESLLDKSLVRRRIGPDQVERFWMLETIHEFALEKLAASGAEAALRCAQADRLIELADRAGTQAIIDVPHRWNLDPVAQELDNIRAVLEWALEHDPERGLQLATWLEAFWVVREPIEGASWLERFLARSPHLDALLRSRALRALGGSRDIVGEVELAAPCYRQSLELSSSLGNEAEASHTRFRIAANMVMRGEKEAAWPLLDEALQEARRLGIRVGEAQALAFQAEKAYSEGELAVALELVLESAEIAGGAGWIWWESGQLHSAATIEREQGNLDAAEGYAKRALELTLELGDRQNMVYCASELAIIAAQRGDALRAGRIWGAIDNEASTRRIGVWEAEAPELERLVLSVDGPAFTAARAEGSLLSIPDAVAGGDRG